jgi:iron complex transport system substrate-binding protein
VAISLAHFARLFLLHVREIQLFWESNRQVLEIVAVGALVFCVSETTLAARPGVRQTGTPEAAARFITDEVGRRVTIPAEVRRVVTLAPNLTETIYALGLEDRLAGDTNYCDTPPAAKTKPHVGETVNPSLEAIVALHPDLVLATTSINRIETVDSLARLGIPVYTSDPQTVWGMIDSTARIADLMGAGKQGAELAARLKQRLEELHSRLSDLPTTHVLFVVWSDPLITIGQKTFIADALRWAGAESVIVSEQKWPQVSLEEVFRLQPDYIVLAGNHTEGNSSESDALRTRPVWKELRAVKAGHIVDLGEEISRPSPGMIDAIDRLAHELHPEAFKPKPDSPVSNPDSHIPSASSNGPGKECIQCTH